MGKYKSEQGFEINVTVEDGMLFAAPFDLRPLHLTALGKTTFTPTVFDEGTVTLNFEVAKTMGFAITDGSRTTQLNRIEET